MIFPIGDDNPSTRVPWVNTSLIAVNVVVFAAVNRFGGLSAEVSSEWGFVPNDPRWYTFVTSVFLHAGFFHIVFNLLFLWVFGDNVEDKLGHALYLLFYLAAGALSCTFFMLFTGFAKGSVPLIGASGAIAGVMGCYMVFFPEARIRVFYWVFWILMGVFRIRAKWALGLWIAMNLVNWLVFRSHFVTGVAYAAHVGGFAVGIGVAILLKGWLVRTGRVTRDDERTGFAPGGAAPSRPAREFRPQAFQHAGSGPAVAAAETDPPILDQEFVSPRVQTDRDHEGFFGTEEAIVECVRTGEMDVALEKYADYVRMRHAKALPSRSQIEIAAELFRRQDYEGALEAYRRYLSRYPAGPDAPEAKFRLGIILSRYRKEYYRAREYLLQAVVEHPDPEIVSFGREELERIAAHL